MTLADRFSRLPTAAKLLLILTAVLLPIGIGLAWVGETGIQQANDALQGRSDDRSRAVAGAVESLIARNALALRIATNGALAAGPDNACERSRRALTVAPAVVQSFELESGDGEPLCAAGEVGDTGALPLLAPGDIRVRIAPDGQAVAIRAGVVNGMATALLSAQELRTAAREADGGIQSVTLTDGDRTLPIVGGRASDDSRVKVTRWPISGGGLVAEVAMPRARVTTLDRLLLLLPLLMWVAAAIITWLLVSRLLVRPLKRLERGVLNYQPGGGPADLPRNLGPAEEIRQLRDAFSRAVDRVQDSERDMTSALEGQRRLVREVHHRVKNNLQVIASLLNIHGRGAETLEARAAYASISRRVSALSIVHRNHFAEMEENRGIALRPLVTELAAELRAGAPDAARGLMIDLDLDTAYTTQDVAVAVAFLVTEIVEFAMLNAPEDPVEISLRRTSELTTRLAIGSRVLVPDDQDQPEKIQFERIVTGLAKQLRSTLERKLGRYSVDLPVFPSA